MPPFLQRRRWWFLGALGLAALGTAATFVVVDLKRAAAYDRVHMGMKSIQAHRILMDAGAMDLGTGDWVSLNKYRRAFRHTTSYRLGDNIIRIDWDKDGQVLRKERERVGPGLADRVLAWLTSVRSAVAL